MVAANNAKAAGWNNAKIALGCTPLQNALPNIFLGRFEKADADPFRKFMGIPNGASTINVTFDFFEIDSWDGPFHVRADGTKIGPDSLQLKLNNLVIDLGNFDWEDKYEGIPDHSSDYGVEVVSNESARLCFGNKTKTFVDQIHHFTITLPRKYFLSGELTLAFQVLTNQPIADESAGFDNIKIVVNECDLDGDGVGDLKDLCASTLKNSTNKVDVRGCNAEQNVVRACGCKHLVKYQCWTYYDTYEACVRASSRKQVAAGLMNSTQKQALIKKLFAKESSCVCRRRHRMLRSPSDQDESDGPKL